MLHEGLPGAIEAYFQSERASMIVNLTSGALLLGAVIGLWLLQRDGFARGLLLSGTLVALIVIGSSAFILQRDPPRRAALVAAAQVGQPMAQEEARMAKILADFQRARIGVTVMGVVAIALLTFLSHGFTRGAAAGVLLFVLVQIVADHYSEQRSLRYHAALAAAA